MHFNPILLVQADCLEEAKQQVESFCECNSGEHSYFDYGSIVPDEKTEFNKPLSLVKGKLPVDDHIEAAIAFVKKANKMLAEKSNGTAGYYFEKAGSLLQQHFCAESEVFNIQYYDYSRDFDDDGWYAIETDFHF
jgi:uncharacterized protein YkuJ